MQDDGPKSKLAELWDRIVEKVFVGFLLLNAAGLVFMGYLAWVTPKAVEEGVTLKVKSAITSGAAGTTPLPVAIEADPGDGTSVFVTGTMIALPTPGDTIAVTRTTNYLGINSYVVGPRP